MDIPADIGSTMAKYSSTLSLSLMLDTIKVGIPLSASQLAKLQRFAADSDRWQWIQHHPRTGELRFIRHSGLAEMDGQSYHREIRWDIPDRYHPEECYLVIELSLPKFWNGHNIRLLYGWVEALGLLKQQLEKQLHCRFAPVMEWLVKRADICFAWQCPSQAIAQSLLDSLSRLDYPRKKPDKRPTSLTFKGATYSFKIYLKHPEFIANDMRELIKGKASLEWIEYLEKLAEGVIRAEATLRQKYLARKGIKTVADLAQQIREFELRLTGEVERIDGSEILKDEADLASRFAILCYQKNNGIDFVKNIRTGVETPIREGLQFSAPALELQFNGVGYKIPGGTLTGKVTDLTVNILSYFLTKFIGDYKGMDTPGIVKEKLLSTYKSDKALRLLGFYLYVQQFGQDAAKSTYSERAFYRNKSDLKKAGINLVSNEFVVTIDEQFIQNFQLEIPSLYVVNKFDDYRDHGNLLNLESPDAQA